MKHRQISVRRARHLLIYNVKTGALRRRPGTYRHERRCRPVVGTINKDGYLVVKLDGHTYLAHRIIFFMMKKRWPEPTVDHRNRKGTDNRWRNLREASHLMQTRNRRISRGAR